MNGVIVYVLLTTLGKKPAVVKFEGMSQPIIEHMLKEQNLKYQIITQKEYETSLKEIKSRSKSP